jgi:hypothetical protein
MPPQTTKKAKGLPKRAGKRKKNGKADRLARNTFRNKLNRILKSSGKKEAEAFASRFNCLGILVGLPRHRRMCREVV